VPHSETKLQNCAGIAKLRSISTSGVSDCEPHIDSTEKPRSGKIETVSTKHQ
jgi:hypothetical protein